MNNKYIKKSVEIEAIQWNGTNLSEIQEFGKGNLDINICTNRSAPPLVTIEIKTLEGVMKLNENDYLIKGVKGEYYPCKPDIFELTYEKVYTLEEVIKEWEEKEFEVENNSKTISFRSQKLNTDIYIDKVSKDVQICVCHYNYAQTISFELHELIHKTFKALRWL